MSSLVSLLLERQWTGCFGYLFSALTKRSGRVSANYKAVVGAKRRVSRNLEAEFAQLWVNP